MRTLTAHLNWFPYLN